MKPAPFEYQAPTTLREAIDLLVSDPEATVIAGGAVRYAAEVQRGTAERNTATPPEKQIEFRVGINLGDVIAEGEDIFGDVRCEG